MHTLMTFVSEADRCQYLSDQQWRFEYEIVASATPSEYGDRLRNGWRRFGYSLFRPVCDTCMRCQSVRVPVSSFTPDRSQRRAWKANDGTTTLTIGEPSETAEKRQLFDDFHRYQHDSKGWSNGTSDYQEMFVANPFPTEEWCYRIAGRLVGVGYVDRVPDGLSLIYFFHDPQSRDRSLGTFNILRAIEVARAAMLPNVYLGYYVEGCRSLEYKGRFRPNESLRLDGSWQPFLTR
jgi:leucyl-tRNA---protein transferase